MNLWPFQKAQWSFLRSFQRPNDPFSNLWLSNRPSDPFFLFGVTVSEAHAMILFATAQCFQRTSDWHSLGKKKERCLKAEWQNAEFESNLLGIKPFYIPNNKCNKQRYPKTLGAPYRHSWTKRVVCASSFFWSIAQARSSRIARIARIGRVARVTKLIPRVLKLCRTGGWPNFGALGRKNSVGSLVRKQSNALAEQLLLRQFLVLSEGWLDVWRFMDLCPPWTVPGGSGDCSNTWMLQVAEIGWKWQPDPFRTSGATAQFCRNSFFSHWTPTRLQDILGIKLHPSQYLWILKSFLSENSVSPGEGKVSVFDLKIFYLALLQETVPQVKRVEMCFCCLQLSLQIFDLTPGVSRCSGQSGCGEAAEKGEPCDPSVLAFF